MSKLSFRARALDAAKPMPIYIAEELPDLPDYSAINRAVPPMPTGMEKEEESEHHLQRAICTGLIIPTPEVYELADTEAYDRLYPPDFKMPRQLIHMQPFAMEQDIPDYDIDSDDEKWVNAQAKKMDITALKFEEMMDRLEKGSGQKVVTLQEAKSLLKEDDDLIIAVYDYWLNKRLKMQHPLIPQVKTENRPGISANNPYLAFRRRTEKMQTRKNRKNDETSYEKMLKLKRDLSRAVTLLEMVKRREKTKREHLHLTIEIFEKRYQVGDFSGQLLAEVSALKNTRPAFAPLFSNQFGVNQNWANKVTNKEEVLPRKEKRQYKKRKHKGGALPQRGSSLSMPSYTSVGELAAGVGGYPDTLSSEDEGLSGASPSDVDEEEADSEGPFAFRRKKFCNYHAPLSGSLGNWPWCGREEGGLADRKYRYCLTSLATPQRHCVGFARRRVGRGGRIILDRGITSMDDFWSSLDFTIQESDPKSSNTSSDDFVSEIRNEWIHFRPKTPPVKEEAEEVNVYSEDVYEIPSSISIGVEDDSDPSVSVPMEFNLEDFQTPVDDSVALQRLHGDEQDSNLWPSESNLVDHSFITQPSSRFNTLDASSSQFAVSAVFSTTPFPGILSSLTSPLLTNNCSSGSNSLKCVTTPATSSSVVSCSGVSELSGGMQLTNGPLSENPTCSRTSSSIKCSSTVSTSKTNASSSSVSSSQPSVPHSPNTLTVVTAVPGSDVLSVSVPLNVLTSKTITAQNSKLSKTSQSEVTAKSEESADGDKDQASNQVCVDKLIRKNALPMEVT